MNEILANIVFVLAIAVLLTLLYSIIQFVCFTRQAWREFRQEREDEKREGELDDYE